MTRLLVRSLSAAACLSAFALPLTRFALPAHAASTAVPAAAAGMASKEADKLKLAAAEAFEKLTESAASASPKQLDALIVAAKSAGAEAHSGLSEPAQAALTLHLEALAKARSGIHRTNLAIASVEIYRTLITDTSGERAVPVAVNLLDYCGFRYRADLQAAPPRWTDMDASVGIARVQWAGLSGKITDLKLRGRFDTVLADMAAASATHNDALAATAVQRELDLVDELEKQFPDKAAAR